MKKSNSKHLRFQESLLLLKLFMLFVLKLLKQKIAQSTTNFEWNKIWKGILLRYTFWLMIFSTFVFFPFAFEPELFLLFSAQYRSRWGKRFSIKISIGFFSLSRGNLVCCSSSESYLGGKCLLAFNWKWERNILYTPLTHNTVSSKLFID